MCYVFLPVLSFVCHCFRGLFCCYAHGPFCLCVHMDLFSYMLYRMLKSFRFEHYFFVFFIFIIWYLVLRFISGIAFFMNFFGNSQHMQM